MQFVQHDQEEGILADTLPQSALVAALLATAEKCLDHIPIHLGKELANQMEMFKRFTTESYDVQEFDCGLGLTPSETLSAARLYHGRRRQYGRSSEEQLMLADCAETVRQARGSGEIAKGDLVFQWSSGHLTRQPCCIDVGTGEIFADDADEAGMNAREGRTEEVRVLVAGVESPVNVTSTPGQARAFIACGKSLEAVRSHVSASALLAKIRT